MDNHNHNKEDTTQEQKMVQDANIQSKTCNIDMENLRAGRKQKKEEKKTKGGTGRKKTHMDGKSTKFADKGNNTKFDSNICRGDDNGANKYQQYMGNTTEHRGTEIRKQQQVGSSRGRRRGRTEGKRNQSHNARASTRVGDTNHTARGNRQRQANRMDGRTTGKQAARKMDNM